MSINTGDSSINFKNNQLKTRALPNKALGSSTPMPTPWDGATCLQNTMVRPLPMTP